MWKWVLLGGFVLWYLTQREKAAIPIAANRAAQGTIDAAGRAASGIINEAGPAIGKWLSGLFSGGGSSSSAPSSGGTTSAATTADFYNWGADGDYV